MLCIGVWDYWLAALLANNHNRNHFPTNVFLGEWHAWLQTPTPTQDICQGCEHQNVGIKKQLLWTPYFGRLATSGLLWYFRHVATCNHQKNNSSFAKKQPGGSEEEFPPKSSPVWEFYNPRKITWKPKILVSKTNLPLPEIPPFSGCNQL